jgi:hypothetical protein
MTLAAYITANFPQIKSQLAWLDSDQIVTIVAKAVELYGVSTEAEATNSTKLHALADVAVWRQALNDISLDYAFAADNASYSRNQAVQQVRDNLSLAEAGAMAYMPAYKMIVHPDEANADWFSS